MLLMMLSRVTERVAELMLVRHRGHVSPLLSRTSCRQPAQKEWPQPRVVALLNISRQMGHWSSSQRPATADAGLLSVLWLVCRGCRLVWLVAALVCSCRGMAPFVAELAAAAAALLTCRGDNSCVRGYYVDLATIIIVIC